MPYKDSTTRQKWRSANKDRRLRDNYGITKEQYDDMIVAQEGRCDICSCPMQKPAVDHCHVTEHIRGLLCFKCNNGLGIFNDDLGLLQAAIQYLSKPVVYTSNIADRKKTIRKLAPVRSNPILPVLRLLGPATWTDWKNACTISKASFGRYLKKAIMSGLVYMIDGKYYID